MESASSVATRPLWGANPLVCVFWIAAATCQGGLLDLRITEIYSGDRRAEHPENPIYEGWRRGTVDWFEITNTGNDVVSLGDAAGWVASSVVPVPPNGWGELPNIQFDPQESLVFLLGEAPIDDTRYSSATEEFAALWGDEAKTVALDSSFSFGQFPSSSFLIVVFESPDPGSRVALQLISHSSMAGTGLTSLSWNGVADFLDVLVSTQLERSQVGLHGARHSQEFAFHDGSATIIASPGTVGTVPEPGTALLAFLGALVWWRFFRD